MSNVVRKNTPQEMLQVIQAFIDGKPIEFSHIGFPAKWLHIKNVTWNFSNCNYRVKPESVKVKVALFCYKYNNDILVYTEKEFTKDIADDPYFSKVSDWFEIEADHELLQKAKS